MSAPDTEAVAQLLQELQENNVIPAPFVALFLAAPEALRQLGLMSAWMRLARLHGIAEADKKMAVLHPGWKPSGAIVAVSQSEGLST